MRLFSETTDRKTRAEDAQAFVEAHSLLDYRYRSLWIREFLVSEVVLQLDEPEATRELGARLGRELLSTQSATPVVVSLSGELGAGKTTFVGGLLRAMGVTGAIRSPTYTLIEPYERLGPAGDRDVYHLDLYRLESPRDLEMLALRDLLQPGSTLLTEWAERGNGALPASDLVLTLRYPPGVNAALVNRRTLSIQAQSEAGEVLAHKLVGESC